MNGIKNIASAALQKLMDAGADKASCMVATSEKREFNVDGGEFSLFRTLFDNGLTLTVIVGGKRGVTHINHLDDQAVDEAVKDVMQVAASGESDPAWDIAPQGKDINMSDGAYNADLDLFFERTRELVTAVAEKYPKVVIEQLIADHTSQTSVYVNSNGVCHEVMQGAYGVSLMYSSHEGDAASSFNGSGFRTAALDKPFIECGRIARDLEESQKQVFPVALPGKFTGTVVFTPDCFMNMLYYVFSNFCGNLSILNGTSPWRKLMGQTVADERLTVAIAPRDARIVCGEHHTSDGYASEDYLLIEKGVLKSFMLSNYYAVKTGEKRAPNEAWAFVIEGGETGINDLIAGIEKGILVGRFSGGEPGANGDFSGVAKNSFLIENGKIGSALTETMISGNLSDMLKSMRGLSKEVVLDGGSVMPYGAFDGILVSGK